ncbi:MAG: IPT/TIG domain-containing protein [Dolichospermum sp.]
MGYLGSRPANKIITSTDIQDGVITNADLQNSSITINGAAISLGGSVTTDTRPTVTSISPSTITNDATSITITGTNFVSVPVVEVVNSSTGAIIRANSVSFTSSTSISANFTITVDGTYFIRVENNDGYAVRSTNALLTVSDAPVWSTSAGTLGTFSGGGSVSVTCMFLIFLPYDHTQCIGMTGTPSKTQLQ